MKTFRLALVFALACVHAPPPRSFTPQEQMGGLVIEEIFTRCAPPLEGALEAYVRSVGERLVRAVDDPTRDWKFRVLDLDTVNAWAAPGGRVFVTRGLLVHLSSDAELAAVLAHEMGHVVAGHGRDFLTEAPPTSEYTPSLLARAAVFDRDEERQADEMAVRFMEAAGYDGRAMSSMLRALHRGAAPSPTSPNEHGWARRHPPLPVRLARAERTARPGGDVDVEVHMQAIDGQIVQRAVETRPTQSTIGTAFVEPITGWSLPHTNGWASPGPTCGVRLHDGTFFTYGHAAEPPGRLIRPGVWIRRVEGLEGALLTVVVAHESPVVLEFYRSGPDAEAVLLAWVATGSVRVPVAGVRVSVRATTSPDATVVCAPEPLGTFDPRVTAALNGDASGWIKCAYRVANLNH